MEFHLLQIIIVSFVGVGLASILSLVPALHIYNVVGLIIISYLQFGAFLPRSVFPYLLMSMLVTYSILNTIPSIYLSAPDDSMIFAVLPGQKYMLQGRGHEAGVLTGFGSLMAILFLVILTPITLTILPKIKKLIGPHLYWVLGLVSVYIIMSEWPKGKEREDTALKRLWGAWRSLFAGLMTFILSGFMGLIVLNKTLIPLQSSFQSIMPVFVGLFAVPWILTNVASRKKIPPQHFGKSVDFDAELTTRGTIAGSLGGSLAALFPIITGGVGGLLAGHATAQRDERIFVFSQGVSKTVYYVGAFLFFFVPQGRLGKGGLVAMLGPIYNSYTSQEYWTALAVILLSGGIAFYLLTVYSKLIIKLLQAVDYKWISLATLAILIGIVYSIAGLVGLYIMVVATAIGLIPVLFGSRRLNCMGVLLVPITLNMAGVGPKVAAFLGIL